jgi:NusA family KH domain protein, archaeal
MSLFQQETGVTARDCVIDEENNRIIFLVDQDKMGVAIGRNGANVKRLEKRVGKSIELVGYSENLEELVKNLMAPARVKSIRVVQGNDRKTIYITVEPEDKGLAIGKAGRNVSRARLILKRYADIDSVVIV